MARQVRIEYAGATYHFMTRGNQGQEVFIDDFDRTVWLETLGEACEKTGWSSYPSYLRARRQRPVWLATDRVMGNVGLEPGDRSSYEAHLEARVLELGRTAGRHALEEDWKWSACGDS
jgi:hypothetical protein